MIKYLGKIFLCALSLMVGAMIGGMVSTALRLEQPKIPGQVDMRLVGLYTFAGGVILSVALAELSRRLQGRRWLRFAAIAWLAYAWLGINNPIEASVFTTIGGGLSLGVTMLFLCLFAAGAVGLLFGNFEAEASLSSSRRQFFAKRTAAQWTLRLLLAVLAFPVVYFFFGMPVGLVVGKFYQDQAFGLQMPSLGVIVGVQCIRGLVALLAVMPILVAWPGSRREFAWTFGLSLFVVSGLYGLIQAYWMPWTMRSIHTVELLLDSLAYGWLLALLFLPRTPARNLETIEAVGMQGNNV